MLKPLVRLSLVFAFVFTALLGATALAQQAQPDVYVVVSYIKVLPGQDEAYRNYLTTTGKKLFQELMAANPSFLYWSSARTMYQGIEHGAEFDYIGASVYAGPPPEPGANLDAIYQKATGISQADLGKKLAAMRTVVGTEVLRQRAGITTPVVVKEGDFRVVGRYRIKPGMGDEYYEMARTMGQPMMQARAANGELKGWSVWSRVFPAGAGTSYDALGVTYFKDLASAIKGLDPAKGLETFQKIHPGKSYAGYINNGRDYSELQERFLMQIVAMAERAK
jgi:hypothetical protein